ncbi:MAG: UvrD-helicase domain-containing protein [Breznakibacter sp.]
MSKLIIYKASAGSGKTFTITREFIQLLFNNPFDYKHLLAVTFTNKATAEMKGRIIETLFTLWAVPYTKAEPAYAKELVEIEGDELIVRQKAAFILHLILHDFSGFTVSTIDSFFQRIIRSFLQELGLHSGFKTELDNKKVLEMAVDRLVMQMGQNDRKELREWLLRSSQENMESGQSWDVAKQLRSLGQEVLTEKYQSFSSLYLNKLNDKKLLVGYKKELEKIVDEFETQIEHFGKSSMEMIRQRGLNWDCFPQKSRSPFKVLEKMASLSDGWEKNDGLRKYLNDAEGWVNDKKNAHLKAQMFELYHSGLNQLLLDCFVFIDRNKILWHTSMLILKNFNALGIINDIANEMDTICRDESVFLLSNSNRLLYKVIGENEAPFVYEKSGNFFKHFMIDEFQDTSALQWNNFKPLIENSLSQNNFSMVVGDVKQSIYRWRNSDWKLLAEQVQRDFTVHGAETRTLDTNWRSYSGIIDFNNQFFTLACRMLQESFNSRLENVPKPIAEQWNRKILNAYANVIQNVSPSKIASGGYVQFEFVDAASEGESFSSIAVRKALSMVKSIVDNGTSFNDICILVRKADEARLVTNALMSGELLGHIYPVVSNEALMLSNSLAVNTLVNQLYHILDPNNAVYSSHPQLYLDVLSENEIPLSVDANKVIGQLGNHRDLTMLKGLPLIDLIEKLVQQLPDKRLKQEGVFIQAFVDSVTSYVQDGTSDLAGFLDWWENEGQNKSVSVPEDQNAIRVMTVHKSKGLEFKHVVMPFLNWEMSHARHTSYLWCHDPFNQLDYIPVKFEKGMLESSFANDYLNELLHQYVDNLNLLYVAFTRAKQSIWGIIPHKTDTEKAKKEDEAPMSSINNLLGPILLGNPTLLGHDVKVENALFIKGTFPIGDGDKTKPIDDKTLHRTGKFQTVELPQMKSWEYASRIGIFMESENFLDNESKRHIFQGKVMHRLFEMIRHKQDVEQSIHKLVLEGLIESSQYNYWIEKVNGLLNQPLVENWFQQSANIMNERTILDGDRSFRPDRVVIGDDKVTVIDYKFGETHSPTHLLQVKRYMEKISQMGYPKTEGYVWYVLENQLVMVDRSLDSAIL